ncbi:hypothetical protein, partial [Gardnerella vaginalis]|uniref:hypothetical protein n=1 Tax=Gardnerella vaginalis TaxID=2702 RepID=UPI001E36EFFC
ALKELEIPLISSSVKARAKAGRRVSLLRRKVQWTFRASSAASAYSASVLRSVRKISNLYLTNIHTTE